MDGNGKAISAIQWLMTAAALAGAALNVAGYWQGFGFWSVTSMYWAIYNFERDEYAQATVYAAFWVLSVAGMMMWTR